MNDDWLVPQLSLATQLEQELDRRKAAKLSHHELSGLVDTLICKWYHNQELINRLLRRVQQLEVKIALAESKPSNPEPSAQHYQWAQDLLSLIRQ
jgi:hypothetical protein